MLERPWDDPAGIRELLSGPDGPVVRELLPMAGRVIAAGARRRCPVLTGATRSRFHWYLQAGPAGPEVIIAGSFVVTFLEKPAEQMHRARHPLTNALDDF